MTKVSRMPVQPPELMGVYIDNFWNAITLLETKTETKEFLRNILSHTEIKMVAKRLQIAKMLIEDYDYQTIKNEVKVTSNTIARISNELNTNGSGLKKIIDRIIRLEEQKKPKPRPIISRPKTVGSVLVESAAKMAADAAIKKIKKTRKRRSVKVQA